MLYLMSGRVFQAGIKIEPVNDMTSIYIVKKLINNSRGKYKRNECLINVCKSDKDLS
jgi:hypothetical protein